MSGGQEAARGAGPAKAGLAEGRPGGRAALQRIPVKVEGPARRALGLRWKRRAVQLGTLALAVLVPALGLFRIDPVDGAIVVLDRQVWFSDFFLVFGFWIAAASALVVTYSTLGMVFCGWSCPQNTLAEWADRMTRRLLGKRAEVDLDGRPMRVSRGKDKWLNWLLLAGAFLGVSLVVALVPLFWFYPPEAIWSFVTFREDPRLAGSLHWIYAVFVLIVLLDVAFIRHFWCRFMCIYRVWQHSFKTRETLRVAWDGSEPETCARCGYCATSCFIGIDPRRTETFDSCINCGECIAACAQIRGRKGKAPLLRFVVGAEAAGARPAAAAGEGVGPAGTALWRTALSSLRGRIRLTIPLTLLGLAMFAWGLHSYQPYRLTAFRAEQQAGGGAVIDDYRIEVAHKVYRPAAVRLEVEGLPPGSYRLSREVLRFQGTGHRDALLHIDPGLPRGLHPVLIRARSDDGWSATFRIQHFAMGEG